MAKIFAFDIETSTFGFKANSGFILCCGIQEIGKPMKMLVRDNMTPDPLNDKKLAIEISAELSKADVLVGHNSKWFDLPFINSRLLHWGLPPLPPIAHFDTCDTSYKKLKIKNSLEAVGEFLGCKIRKFKVSFDEWVRAYAGNKKSLAKIVKHCMNDVKLTVEVYNKLRVLGFKHPNIATINDDPNQCPICGKKNTLNHRGFIYGAVNKSKRYRCMKQKGGCGGWSHTAYRKSGVDIRP